MCTSFTRRVSSRFGLSAYYILEIAIFLWVRSRIQVMVITLAFGLVTPPVGTSLYLTAGIAKVPVTRVIRETLPMLLVVFACLLVVALVPELSTWLPKAME